MVKYTTGLHWSALRYLQANLWICSNGETQTRNCSKIWGLTEAKMPRIRPSVSRDSGPRGGPTPISNPEIGFRPLSIHKSKTTWRNRSFSHNFGCRKDQKSQNYRVEIVPCLSLWVLVPFWLCQWVQVDDHVCFSVRNMPKRTTATSQNDQFQNIPENSSHSSPHQSAGDLPCLFGLFWTVKCYCIGRHWLIRWNHSWAARFQLRRTEFRSKVPLR